ncbi:toll-like receptor 2 [Gadus chalcogrammus]|uniref:toll-like receptor 2 n=1 Tax=Gadus chalcogrammus TaxID=1042646 RepID=UPI0024C36331|nr:toll-like receptor 2 [Gadus chalcogrammus]
MEPPHSVTISVDAWSSCTERLVLVGDGIPPTGDRAVDSSQHRAIDAQQDSLVFILLEPIPTNSLPKKFLKLRRLLMQQTYLEWPMDERKQQVFWVNLRSMLQVADHRILKDMALELAQSASLIPDDLDPLLK